MPMPSLVSTPDMPPARGEALEVRDVHLTRGGATILDGVTLSLAAGGCTMILGPNGAGKSMLLKVLHGLIAPSDGTVTWGGIPAAEATSRQSLVFQKPVLLRRSARSNIEFVLSARGRPRDEADALLARVGLAHKSEQPARLLSGGEAQRLQLARALATDPDVLLLDEPTANLDPASVAAFEGIVAEVVADGVTVIFVTHDIGQARRLGDDIVFLHRGRVRDHAPRATFFSGATSAEAQDFIKGNIVV